MDSFPDIEFVIRQTFKQLLLEKVEPWVFLNTGKMQPITEFNGRRIYYRGGVGFDGSPRFVFWNGFIEPFLEDLIIKSFDFARIQAEKKHLPLLQLFNYVRACLSSCINEIYCKMQDIDRRLRGGGYPSRVDPFDITNSISAMEKILQAHYHATLPKLLEDTGGTFMSRITENALIILKYLVDNDKISGAGAVVGQLILSTGLTEQDFDSADSYLLEKKYVDATQGGKEGHRTITSQGIDFYEERMGLLKRIDTMVSGKKPDPKKNICCPR